MGRNRFVEPDIKRLELSDGDWIEVKERLTYGEQQHMLSSSVRRYKAEDESMVGGFGVSLEYLSLAKLATWLVDWSFRDGDDKPVPVSRSAIEALDPTTADEIVAALNAHIESLEKN